MNEDIQELLHRFREDELTPEEWHRLNELLDRPEGREALRRDWFLEAAMPQSLAAAAVAVRTPRSSLAERFRTWIALPRTEEPALAVLQLWSRASLAALTIGLFGATWAVWPQHETMGPESTGVDSDPAFIAQLILENQLSDAP